jgi:hypothetical protein
VCELLFLYAADNSRELRFSSLKFARGVDVFACACVASTVLHEVGKC